MTVDGILGPGGALSGVLKGYEIRPPQLEMARAVEAALGRQRFLLAEAGTGTGKTLAYLVPAVLSGKRVIVSTATRTLQEQVFHKDIPLLRDTVGLAFESALLKGRANYLCAERFERFERTPLFSSPEAARHWERFCQWAMSTETGDMGETEIPDDWAPWAEVSTTTDSCLGSKCPHALNCFVTRARRAAEDCHVVVVNHALFFADLALRQRGGNEELGVLPSADAVIFDEAHALEDVATEFLGQSTSSGRVYALAQDTLKALPPLDARSPTLTAVALALRGHADTFFGAAAEALGLGHGHIDSSAHHALPLLPEMLDAVRPSGAVLVDALNALAALCPADDGELGGVHRRARDAAQVLAATLRADDPAQVYWAEPRGRGIALRSAPIDVGRPLAQALYPSAKCVVFTSATLRASSSGSSASNGFDFVVARLGLSQLQWDALSVESPFDFARQSALYVPKHLPEPSHATWTLAFAREVFRLVRLFEGRAFVLFTSMKQLDRVHELVAPHLSVQVLKQGAAPKRVLLESFIAQPSVLFASQSFWEGVDVPGEALSLVVIDRLPFAPPGDPLQGARMEAVRLAGRNPFDEYQVPQAVLALRQGFGRLIRTAKDRGVVALGDVRILTKRYGRAFLEGLPPAPQMTYLHEVSAWWAQR